MNTYARGNTHRYLPTSEQHDYPGCQEIVLPVLATMGLFERTFFQQ